MIHNRIPLPRVPTELKAATGQDLPYRRLYGRVLDGLLPMVQQDANGRYYVKDEDLPALAEKLGLHAPATVAA